MVEMVMGALARHVASHTIKEDPSWDLHTYIDCTQHTNAMACCIWSAQCVGTTRLFATSIEAARASNEYQYHKSRYGCEPRILVWDWGWQIT